jgi:hypothetical protein
VKPRATPIADLAHAAIDGQRRAERILAALRAAAPAGDELQHGVSQNLPAIATARSAFLRGFWRRIQKELEVRP